jgi:hypothetical protein
VGFNTPPLGGGKKTVTIRIVVVNPTVQPFLSNDRFFVEKSDTPLLAAG